MLAVLGTSGINVSCRLSRMRARYARYAALVPAPWRELIMSGAS
jgi:hypothetical protein